MTSTGEPPKRRNEFDGPRYRALPRGERRNMARDFRRRYPRHERKGHTISDVERNGPKEDEWV